MTQLLPKAKKWIDDKKDPRSAYWQAGIEAVMELFLPDMEKGRLTPVCPLEGEDLSMFKAVLANVDLSPGLWAAFLPPSIANSIFPPEWAEELMRIEKEKPSYKIIIMRSGKEERILCAEISKHAHRPGVDIFQSGAFLGNFDYDTHEICIVELTKAIRAHAWEKNSWQRNDYMTYTLNWFEKSIYLGKGDVCVDKSHSFFHSPTLIRTNRVDALFLVLSETLNNRFKDDSEVIHKTLPRIDSSSDSKEKRLSACQSLAETYLLDLLNMVKNLDLLDFAAFTNAESHSFKNEFERTVRILASDLDAVILG